MLRAFGKRLVLMDFAGGINKYRFALGCILVRDDRGRGFGGAFGITSTESAETVTKFVDVVSPFLFLSKCPACNSCSFASFSFLHVFQVRRSARCVLGAPPSGVVRCESPKMKVHRTPQNCAQCIWKVINRC